MSGKPEVPEEAVEAAERAYGHAAPYLSTENAIREALEAAAPFIAAKALEGAADELARLPYAKPDAPERPEYERLLAVRRGGTDKWLRSRAAAVRGDR